MQAMMRREMRETQVNVRLNAEESERADRLAAHYGLTLAFTIRMLLKREHDAVFPPTSPAPAAAPSRPRAVKKTKRSASR
ncbi:hypothetical protein BH11MYX4_BH11MYX4_03900 [soil metagenome]